MLVSSADWYGVMSRHRPTTYPTFLKEEEEVIAEVEPGEAMAF
jgi:hypothetical protein